MLEVVACADGQMLVGPRQAQWLHEHGHVGEPEDHGDFRRWHELTGLTVEEADELICAQRELRECDFCRLPKGGWLIQHRRPVSWTLHPGLGPKLVRRPFVCCDECADFIRTNDKHLLVRHCIERLYRQVTEAANGGRRAAAAGARYTVEYPSFEHARKALTPMVREVVYGMFSVREGEPVKDD